MNEAITVALVDDHVLLRNALAGLIKEFGYTVTMECSNGKELINKIDKNKLPDVILMDIAMPEMDGFETTLWLKRKIPEAHVIALTMYDDEISIIQMLKNGARGYVLKDAHPRELKRGIDAVVSSGFYYSDLVSGRMIKIVQQDDNDDHISSDILDLSKPEIEFLKLLCTELTYKEIADKMNKSPRTVDGYRDKLFEKLNIKNRVGLAMYALRKGVVRF